jgi:hypothetical protein
MKILKLKDANHNKLFHLEKLIKAEVIKINANDHHFRSTPKPSATPIKNDDKNGQKQPIKNPNKTK